MVKKIAIIQNKKKHFICHNDHAPHIYGFPKLLKLTQFIDLLSTTLMHQLTNYQYFSLIYS